MKKCKTIALMLVLVLTVMFTVPQPASASAELVIIAVINGIQLVFVGVVWLRKKIKPAKTTPATHPATPSSTSQEKTEVKTAPTEIQEATQEDLHDRSTTSALSPGG